VEGLQVSHRRSSISVQFRNIIAGLVGGEVLGQIVTLASPSVAAAAQSGNLSVTGVVLELIAGGASDAMLTAIIGAFKNKAFARRSVQYVVQSSYPRTAGALPFKQAGPRF